MPSLADFLQFLLRQPAPGSNPFGSNGATLGSNGAHNDPLSADPLGPSDTSTQILQNAENPWAAFGLSAQPGSPAYQSPEWDVASPSSNRGILGGYASVPGSPPDASRPAGILYTYDNPERSQAGSLLGQPFDPVSLNSLGGNALSIFNLPLSRLLTGTPASSGGALPFTDVAPLAPPAGKVGAAQPSRNPQSGTENDYPQEPRSGIPIAPQSSIPFAPQRLQPAPAAARAQEFPKDQTYRNFGIDARIHYPGTSGWSGIETDDGWVTPHALPEDGEQDHWSAYLEPAQVVLPSAKTGDPRIDRTSEFLLDALVEAVKDLGPNVPEGMRPTVFGTLAHTRFANKVRELDLPGIGQDGVEQTWSPQDWFYYGISGSKRTDVYLKDEFGRPIAIYDLKTGNARLTPARIRELREAVGAGDIPVLELSWRDLTAFRRWP